MLAPCLRLRNARRPGLYRVSEPGAERIMVELPSNELRRSCGEPRLVTSARLRTNRASMKSAARPRDARITRERLLQAARTRMAVHGYDEVTLREIAADIGVDVAMINRYFGTKDDLFREVLDTEAPGLRFLEGDPSTVGERLATAVFQGSVEAADLDNLMILVRSLGSERGRALAQDTRITRFQQPLIDWLRGPQASERAFLISSLVVGAIVTREFLGKSCGPDADYGAVQTRFAEILQTLVKT